MVDPGAAHHQDRLVVHHLGDRERGKSSFAGHSQTAQGMAGPRFLCLSIRGIRVTMPLAFRDQDTCECIGFLIQRT